MKYLALISIAVICQVTTASGDFWVLKEPSGVNSEFRWNEAMSTCHFKGGHLATINSQAEADEVVKVMEKAGITEYAHIGFSDLISEGYYLTLEGLFKSLFWKYCISLIWKC